MLIQLHHKFDMNNNVRASGMVGARTARREKPTEMSFLGLRERCQYCAVATGLGSTTPAVYAACQMPCRFTRRVTSCTTPPCAVTCLLTSASLGTLQGFQLADTRQNIYTQRYGISIIIYFRFSRFKNMQISS